MSSAAANPRVVPDRGMFVIIVDRGHPEMFDQLSTVFGEKATVRVIWDRRGEPERRAYPRGRAERVPGDRRAAVPESWVELHVVVVMT